MSGNDQQTAQAKRPRATRAERLARLQAEIKELAAQEKRAKKAENWRNIRVMAYAMASALQMALSFDDNGKTYATLMRMAQRTLNHRDRARLMATFDQLGLSGKLSSDEQEPLTLQDSGWCRSPMMRDGSPSSGQ